MYGKQTDTARAYMVFIGCPVMAQRNGRITEHARERPPAAPSQMLNGFEDKKQLIHVWSALPGYPQNVSPNPMIPPAIKETATAASQKSRVMPLARLSVQNMRAINAPQPSPKNRLIR